MMKLTQSLCKKCFSRTFKTAQWNNYDNARWNSGRVFCIYAKNVISIGEFPQGCPFLLEHIVNGQDKCLTS